VDALAAEPARVDLANRGDVEALLRAFYGQVLVATTSLRSHSRKSG
jgi:hypothetical protein